MYPANWYGKVDELPEGRSGSPLNPDGSREYIRQFLVEVTGDGKLMGPIGVCSHPYLPRPWSMYVANTEYDTLALLVKYDAKQRNPDDWSQWIVTATYSTVNNGDFQAPPDGGAAGDLPNNPASAYSNPEYRYPKIEWDFEDFNRPTLTDLDNKVYQNSAHQPFTPPQTIPQAMAVLKITRNELNFNQTVAADFAYSVNDRDFLGSPAGFVQCLPPRAVQQFHGQIRFWEVSYRLRFHPRGIWLPAVIEILPGVVDIDRQNYELNWQPVMQDQGYMRLENRLDENGRPLKNFGQPVAIIRGNQAVTQQVLLDGQGQEARVRDPLTNQLVPYYLKFRQYKSKNFTDLIRRGFT